MWWRRFRDRLSGFAAAFRAHSPGALRPLPTATGKPSALAGGWLQAFIPTVGFGCDDRGSRFVCLQSSIVPTTCGPTYSMHFCSRIDPSGFPRLPSSCRDQGSQGAGSAVRGDPIAGGNRLPGALPHKRLWATHCRGECRLLSKFFGSCAV